MAKLRYTEEHEWIRLESDGTATVGITRYAQEQLGDLVFVELPSAGDAFSAGDEAVVIESVKAASDVKMPVDGTIVEVNEALVNDPSLVNSEPEGAGWFFRMSLEDPSVLDTLLDEAAYAALIG